MVPIDTPEKLRGCILAVDKELQFVEEIESRLDPLILYVNPPKVCLPSDVANTVRRLYAAFRDVLIDHDVPPVPDKEEMRTREALAHVRRLGREFDAATGKLNDAINDGIGDGALTSIEPPKPASPTARTKSKATPRPARKRTSYQKGLTTRQNEAVELYAKHHGKIAVVARAMKLKHPTVIQHLEAANRKLPAASRLPLAKRGGRKKTRALSADRRGQLTAGKFDPALIALQTRDKP